MISPQSTDPWGIVRRHCLNYRISEDLRSTMVMITLPRWMLAWLGRQPESTGLLVEKALIQHFGAEPPEHVKRALERHKADIQQKLDAKSKAKHT